MEKVTIVLDRECAVRLRSIMSANVRAADKLDKEFKKNGIPINGWMALENLQQHRILDAVEAAINNAEEE